MEVLEGEARNCSAGSSDRNLVVEHQTLDPGRSSGTHCSAVAHCCNNYRYSCLRIPEDVGTSEDLGGVNKNRRDVS